MLDARGCLTTTLTPRERIAYDCKGKLRSDVKQDFETRTGPMSQSKKPPSFKEMDIFAKLNSRDYLKGFGALLCPRQEAVNLFSAAFYEGRAAEPPNIPFFASGFHEAPLAPQDPVCHRSCKAERSREKQNGERTPCLNARQLALQSRRFIVARQVADALSKFGGMGAKLTNLVRSVELSVAQNIKTAPRYKKTPGPCAVASRTGNEKCGYHLRITDEA